MKCPHLVLAAAFMVFGSLGAAGSGAPVSSVGAGHSGAGGSGSSHAAGGGVAHGATGNFDSGGARGVDLKGYTVTQTTIAGRPATVVRLAEDKPITQKDRDEIVKAGFKPRPTRCVPEARCTTGVANAVPEMYCRTLTFPSRYECFNVPRRPDKS